MKTCIFLLAVAALPAAAAIAAERPPARTADPIECHWRATQQSGIPVRMCLSRRQWAQRVAYTQQAIREYQARSFVHP